MPYSDIASRVTIEGSTDFQSTVTAALTQIYEGSASARAAINGWLASHSGNLTITFVPGVAETIPGSSGHINIDPAYFQSNYYIDTNGNVARDTFISGLTHELGHAVTGLADNDSLSNPEGDNVELVNTWFKELGFAQQASYEAYDVGPTHIDPAASYTDGHAIETAFFEEGLYKHDYSSGSFLLDTDNINLVTVGGPALIVGGGGEDNDVGTNSEDWLYGQGGNDQLDGARGGDHLYGGAGNDTLVGGQGNDELWGGDKGQDNSGADGVDTADYSTSPGAIRVTFDGTDSAHPAIAVADGYGSTDTLHSIESIVGTAGRDTLVIVGHIGSQTLLTVDAAGGQAPNLNETINTSQAATGLQLNINADGTGSVADSSSGGSIQLVGFHTGIVGSAYDDEIIDLSSGSKHIDGGDGNDTITVDGGDAIIHGGSGQNSITAGSGNDVIDAGPDGFSTVNGGNGSDLIVSTGSGDSLNGGDGADYIKVSGHDDNVDGGAGNDLIDLTALPPHSGEVTVHFDAQGGHDDVQGDASNVHLDLDSSGVSFVWDAHEIYDTGGLSWHDFVPGEVQYEGDLAIIDGGSTIVIHDVIGQAAYHTYYWTGQASDFIDPFFYADITVNGVALDTSNSVITFGSVAPYETAAADYQAGAASSGGNTDGTDGNDNLTGGGGADTLNGGAGNDEFSTSGGNDVFNGGSGDDEVVALGKSADFEASVSGHSIILSDQTGAEGHLTLNSVESVYFQGDDSTETIVSGTSAQDMLNDTSAKVLFGDDGNDTLSGGDGSVYLFGGAGDDQIQGGTGNDTIAGGGGNDRLQGGAGSDTYLWATGDGNDTIADSSADGSWNNLSLSDVASNQVVLAQDGDDLLLTATATGETIRISGQFSSSGTDGIDEIDFANGASWTRDAILAHLNPNQVAGTAGADVLTGTEGADIVTGGTGNDQFHATGDDDVYVWNLGDGDDAISGRGSVSDGSDTIRFGAGILEADVSVVHDAHGQDQIILQVAQGGSITLDAATLDASHSAQVQFADGTFWGMATLLEKADAVPTPVNGTAGAEFLQGTDRADVFDGHGGDDTLSGGEGSDTYSYASGDGNVRIEDFGFLPATDTLNFKDLHADQVYFQHGDGDNVDDLVVVDTTTNQEITVAGQFNASGTDGVEAVHFADGQTLSRSEIQSAASIVHATDGDDFIDVSWSGFTVTPGHGDDTIYVSNSGGGTILFGAGDGHDILESNLGFGYSRTDTLELTGLNPDDVTLTREANGLSGDELVVTVKATGDTFTALWQFNDYGENAGLDQIKFQDGTVWTRSDIPQEFLEAPIHGSATAADSLTGGEGKDQLFGGGGNDTLIGGNGSDFLEGDAGSDSLVGGNGNDTLVGGPSADVLVGGDGDDYLFGGPGTDTLIGGNGADSFVFAGTNPSGDNIIHLPGANSTIMDFNTAYDQLVLTNNTYIWDSSVSDVNGDGVGDLSIDTSSGYHMTLLGVQSLSAVHVLYSLNPPIDTSPF